MQILVQAWNIIRQPSNNNSQVALAIAVIVACSLVGVLCAFFFGIAARGPGIGNSVAGGMIALLSCVGAFAAGGMLGLLFGSPNWGGAVTSSPSVGDENKPVSASAGIRPNTSLERIADWLTTMIVGLSLVHLKTIEDRSTLLGIWLTRAIAGDEKITNGTAGIAIAISFSFAGFLLVYLWAMRFLPSELRSSYSDLQQRIDSIEHKFSNFKNAPIFAVPDHALDRLRARLRLEGLDENLSTEIIKRYETAKAADDEPMKDFGPRDAAGYRLTARVEQIGPAQFQVAVDLQGPTDSPATKVLWLQHNTFAPEVLTECPMTNGQSLYKTTANEAFWLGAVVPISSSYVLLAIDLRTAEGATEEFIGKSAQPPT